jgi:uncharacterized CHY-type Zn-finger protein
MAKSYSDKLRDPCWQKKRLQVLSRDDWTCKLCGDSETTLNVHHKEYVSGLNPWDYSNKQLVTLCEDCHKEISRNEYKEYDFNQFKVLKLNKWQGNSAILFVALPNLCSMSIYDDKREFVVGFNFTNKRLNQVISIFKKAIVK